LLELRTSQRLTPGLYFGFQTASYIDLKCLEHEVMPSLKLLLQTWQDGCATVSFLGTSTSERLLKSTWQNAKTTWQAVGQLY
jgi:hypothetical protein